MVDKPDEPKQATPAGHRIPVPKREDFDRMVTKVAPGPPCSHLWDTFR